MSSYQTATSHQTHDVQRLNPDQCERLFAHGIHEENVFYNRLNFFMVCEALLFAGAISGMMEDKPASRSLIVFICMIGTIVSLLWWFAQVNKLVLLRTLEHRLIETFPEIRESIEIADKRRKIPGWSVSAILAHALPALFLLAWLYLIAHSIIIRGGHPDTPVAEASK
ncbi:hypothetical protein [Longimicrobium sp.]|uniref:RipA family octameric membrane protein n=1 Tax=Longimicrobium sp. TaxID=2029185 RepID=UPI002E339118|nr:hypothetical protein [Longimicrobium sp.]HEX6041069.1 hypothetical protein [Longimicrobium sp.]